MRTDAKAFDAILAGRSPEIAEVARAARALVLDVLRGGVRSRMDAAEECRLWHRTEETDRALLLDPPASAHVRFGFNDGAELADPKQLLEGTGKKFRHVKLASRADVEQAALRAARARRDDASRAAGEAAVNRAWLLALVACEGNAPPSQSATRADRDARRRRCRAPPMRRSSMRRLADRRARDDA